VQINLYTEVFQRYILSQFSGKLLGLGFDIEVAKEKIKTFSNSLTLQDFDNKCLKFKNFLGFCEFLEVSPLKLCDKYYSFISSPYGRTLLEFRQENNLTQKKCAKVLKISPVDIGFFEKGLTYPTRRQYLKLKEALKKYAK